MAFGTKKTATVVPPTFADRMASIKSMFKTAYDNADKLRLEMESEIEKKNSQIISLQKDIEIINVTKNEAEEFMINLEKLI